MLNKQLNNKNIMLLFIKRKLIITYFSLVFLLMGHVVSWASYNYAELIIDNKTKNYKVQAKDIEVYKTAGSIGKYNSLPIEPGTRSEEMSWYNGWLSWESKNHNWYSTLKLLIWKKTGQPPSNPPDLMLNKSHTTIEGIPITIEKTQCYDSRVYPGGARKEVDFTYKFCDYKITVGTGSE